MKKLFSAVTILSASAGVSFGAALSLDGAGDFVSFNGAGVPTGASSFTVSAWINPASIPAGGISGGQITFWGTEGPGGNANGFRLNSEDGLNHYFWGNDHIADPAGAGLAFSDASGPNGDGWHHVAVSYDDGTNNSTFYLNGAPVSTLNRPTDPSVSALGSYLIGTRPGGEEFHGLLDDVSIWNVSLDDATVAAGWNLPIDAGNPAVSPFLVAYWDFEDGLTDVAGGDNNGTFSGDAFIDNGANAPIPEPSSGLLGVLGAMLMLRRRR
ncbi:LamG domain-containing protein [Verrucomicrobiaceae bacterium 227]